MLIARAQKGNAGTRGLERKAGMEKRREIKERFQIILSKNCFSRCEFNFYICVPFCYTACGECLMQKGIKNNLKTNPNAGKNPTQKIR
jgi:hypothetical protein